MFFPTKLRLRHFLSLLRGQVVWSAIATSAGNQQGKEGEILKAAIPYALVYVAITGIIVYIFS